MEIRSRGNTLKTEKPSRSLAIAQRRREEELGGEREGQYWLITVESSLQLSHMSDSFFDQGLRPARPPLSIQFSWHRILEWAPCFSSRDLLLRNELGVYCITDSLPSEPQEAQSTAVLLKF